MPDEPTARAIRAWNLLANGMGGLDWTGLPYAVAHLGITDVPLLIEQLLVIKTHKPPDPQAAPQGVGME